VEINCDWLILQAVAGHIQSWVRHGLVLRQWVSLSFTETKVLNFCLSPKCENSSVVVKPNHFKFYLSKRKKQKYVMSDVVA